MTKLKRWRDAKQSSDKAREYIGIIGKTTTSTTLAIGAGAAATAGKLSSVTVSTRIHFQATDGAKAYHECIAFDAALKTVITKRFEELADEALAVLADSADADALAAASEVAALQSEISAVITRIPTC